MLNTLNKNGSDFEPPIDDASLAITLEIDSPVALMVDGPLTWSPILVYKSKRNIGKILNKNHLAAVLRLKILP